VHVVLTILLNAAHLIILFYIIRLGLTTPSATALSMSFAYDTVNNERSGWIALAILCCQTILSVLLATALNNISSKRQYPTSWMLPRR